MDKHLNIFRFFNDNELDYYEDNLSRAFALCLKYDTVFLGNILRSVLDDKHHAELFNTDYPDYSIKIDLQRRTPELEGYSRVIAVACSAKQISVNQINKVQVRNTKDPETDVLLEINDTCIIFEFKRTSEDCAAQLKCQAEKIRQNCSDDTIIKYVDLNWSKIVRQMLNVLSLEKQINTENQFTNDFYSFLEKKHPEWFPQRTINSIPFPKDPQDPNNYYLSTRLNRLKSIVAHQLGLETKEISGQYPRLVIDVPWQWATEIQIEYPDYDDGRQLLQIKIWIGDTKRQGQLYYNLNTEARDWPSDIDGYSLSTTPYLKFSHFNSGIFWFKPDKNEYKKTHTKEFFDKFAGRYMKESWNSFEDDLTKICPEWKSKTDYVDKLINTNRNYFDLSIGLTITIDIPYSTARKTDKQEDGLAMSNILLKVINSLKESIG